METEGQGRGLCVSFHWLVNERTLIGEPVATAYTSLEISPRRVYHQAQQFSQVIERAFNCPCVRYSVNLMNENFSDSYLWSWRQFKFRNSRGPASSA